MSEVWVFVASAVLIGAGATAVIDLWAAAWKRFRGSPSLDFALVGRWLAYMPRCRFRHTPIAASAPIKGERLIGWGAHYLIGVVFAAFLLAIWGLEWAHDPTLGPALIVGSGSVAAPFLLMQPGMGAGIAARRTAQPWAARLRSLVTHIVFGFGLYASGWIVRFLELLRLLGLQNLN